MNKTSFIQKLLLFIFGLLLTAILLEIGLRMAGGVVLYLQERHNHASLNPNGYRILCLGESTTALGGEDSYPSQLEAMLNAQAGERKFTVINKGIISTTSQYILAHIEQNLDVYKPQMVVVMMGINDKAYIHGSGVISWWKDLRVYKLVHLLYAHITHRMSKTRTPDQTDDLSQNEDPERLEGFLMAVITESVERFHEHIFASAQYLQNHELGQARQEKEFAKQSAIAASSACIELARRFRLQGMLDKARMIMEKNAIFNVNPQDTYLEWGQLYLAGGENGRAAEAFQSALASDPKNSEALLGLARAYHKGHNNEAFLAYALYLQTNPQDYWGNIELAQWLGEDKYYDQAQTYLGRALKITPEYDEVYLDWGQLLDEQGQYKQEEAFYLKEIALYPHSSHPESSRLYQALGQFYQRQGKQELAKGYFLKAAQQGMSEYAPVTLVNYSLLLDDILSRGIKVVVMQYPFRDIDVLKNYLGQRNGVVFVENRKNFNEAMVKGGYWHYFKDNFAYDFGHCTRAGNGLIARNLTEVILKNDTF